MNYRIAFAAVVGMFAVLCTAPARAQNITVQQPEVSVFSVDTVVSVPDRGSAFLGGVGSARSARNSSGIFRNGSSLGGDRSHAGMSVGVYIHDFAAMDEALLNSAPRRNARPATKTELRAQSAFRHLQSAAERHRK